MEEFQVRVMLSPALIYLLLVRVRASPAPGNTSTYITQELREFC
jgi:hypothetical protein